ncbi:acyltransferase family protein [Streptomyces sp. NPDC007983]|uniref:acyltransferase family protein n=1 Tax=Streptomyces sp. NPDC007983 TaxID=3364800 RepID=UPI0036EDF013
MPLPKHLPSLGGMRAIAALVVFSSHIASQPFFRNAEINSTAQVPLDVLGPLAVTFFFMLSGFVLTWAGLPDPSKMAFWRRRWVRVYSLHLPVLLLALALVLWLQEPTMGRSVWDGFLSNLLLVQSWFPDFHEYGSMNPVAWSLSCEMLFYATFPFLFAFFSKVRTERLWSWVVGIWVVAAAVPALALLLPSQPALPWDPNMPEFQYWFIYMFPPVRLLEFALGILMAQIVRRGRWAGPTPGVCALLFAGAFALSFALPSALARVAPMVPLIAMLLGSLAAGDVRGTRSWLGTRTMVLLGELTFAFYVIHYLVIQYGHRFLGGEQGYYRQWDTPAAIGLTVLALGVGLGLAALLHFYVEKPVVRALGRSRKASRASRTPESEPPTPALP